MFHNGLLGSFNSMKKIYLFRTISFIGLFLMSTVQTKATPNIYNFDIFSQENGLPNNQIQCIYQDSDGWMWIGTSQGLSRFDGYNFVNFLPNINDSTSIRGNLVRVIKEDSKGNLLVGTENGGLNIFDKEKETFFHPFKNNPEFKYREVSVNSIEEDEDGNLWLGTDFNLFVLDTAGALKPVQPDNSGFEGSFIRNLKFDNAGNLWLGTNNGVFTFNPRMNEMKEFRLPYSKENLSREIWEIYKDDEGLLWIGTYSSGVFQVDPVSSSIDPIQLNPEVERNETVRSVSKGSFGDYWIGTRGGLYVYSKEKGVYRFFRHDEREPKSISNNSILSIFHDHNGETWIGTRGGLNLLAKSKQVFHNFGALSGNNDYLNSSIIYAFWIDDEGKIWIGTEDGGINIYNPETGKYQYLVTNERTKNSISQNCIKAFLDDKNGNLWVGTFLGGIDVIDLENQKITNFSHNPDDYNSLSDNRVWDFALDRNGDVWVATSRGLDKFIKSEKRFAHYMHLFGNEQFSWIEFDSAGNLWAGSVDEIIMYNPAENAIKRFPEHSRAMLEDSQNRIWITTLDKGVAIYNKSAGPIKYFNQNDGLANNQALCILEDDNHNFWISTSNGLSKFDADENYFQNFTSNDGLSNNQFCYGAAYKTPSGELLFGTVSGFNLFDPDEIIPAENNVPIVLTDLKIFNKSVSVSNDKKAVLTESITESDHIFLNYDQKVFTIEFAALNYVNANKNIYSYMLEGFDRNWNEPSKNRTATYTNLDPGDYILKIKRVIPGVPHSGNIRQLSISVLPPFWKTTWFLSLVFLFILSLIYILVRFFINREKIKNQLVLERVNARKLHELDMMKLKFFTNISHEIRTPLTLILGPLDKIMNNRIPSEQVDENLKLIHRNASNLNKLINQLLDFRKLEAGNLKLNITEGDIVDFTRTIVNSFNDFAVEKQIVLKFNTLKKSLYTRFDPDKIEKILNNLLSNAFKFTGSGGTITVNLSLIFDTEEDDFLLEGKEKQYIEIVVKDTGKGIPAKNINRIFQRFTQLDDEKENSGAGIGLALVKELVNLHKGKIFVNSKPGKGAKFTIHIPYIPGARKLEAETVNPLHEGKNGAEIMERSGELSDTMHSNIMLVVEDNADVRQFISAHFRENFKILEAKDGDEGWKAALETIPDIIISDVIMPHTDGYELCKKLKNDERTSHIPVLLLTALHSKEHEIKGLTTGADDFITKPFDLSVLEVKVQNLLSIRNSLREKYSSTVVLEPTHVELTSPDERFLNKAIEVIEQNISDSDLDIESFATKVGVSRMQLYRKLHALTDMTVKEFIRHIRLKRATQLLTQNKMNISEVAYNVGFKDLSHFRKCFKREYGMSATDYVAKMKNKNTT